MISGVGICRPWPVLLIFIVSLSCCTSCISTARRHRERVSSAVVVGTVYCDTCFQQAFSRDSHYISGAMVAVECGLESSGPAFYQEVETNNKGMFRVVLPFSVTKQVKEIKGCFVKLVKSGEPYCPVASTSNSSSIHFKERKKGKHIFSAGFFTFKPIKQPGLCNQQPDSKLNSLPTLHPLLNPFIPIELNLPTIPTLPKLPQLPPLPPLPPLPGLPNVPYFNAIPQQPSEKGQVRKGEISEAQFFFSPILGSPPNLIHPPPFVPDPSQPPPRFVPDPSRPPPRFVLDPSQSQPPLVPNPSQVPNPLLPPSPPGLLPSVPLYPPSPNLTPVSIIPGLILASPPPPSLASFPIPPTPFSPGSGIPSPPSLVSPENVNP